MERKQIIEYVSKYINQALAGAEVENSKFDLKRQWPNLKEKPHLNEFLKDICSIANTFGEDGFIVFGVDEAAKEQFNIEFRLCGLRDTSDLIGLINKHVDRPL